MNSKILLIPVLSSLEFPCDKIAAGWTSAVIEPVFFDLEPFPDNEKTAAAGTADLTMAEHFVKKGLRHVSDSPEFRIVYSAGLIKS